MILHNAENEITEKQNDDEVEHEAWGMSHFQFHQTNAKKLWINEIKWKKN